jgi:hypothetical protein
VFFVLEYLRVHQLAGYEFPVPWIDESDILWRSIAFAKTGSFYAPQLAPFQLYNRVPGYLLFMGVLFKLWGFSLHFARQVSCALVTASFLVLACMTARYRFRILSALVLGAFLLSPVFVVTGNIGRMEALLLFVVCLGFLLLQRRRDGEALAVLLLAPLIHPNGVYFPIPAIVYVLAARRLAGQERHVTWSGTAALLVTVGLCCSYAIYVAAHWQVHRVHMGNAFQTKIERNIVGHLFTKDNVVLMLAALCCGVYSLKKRLDAGLLLLLAIPAWLVYGVGIEMWYQVFSVLFYALFSIVAVQVIVHLFDQIPVAIPPPVRYVVATALTALFIAWNYQAGRLAQPLNYPWNIMRGASRGRNDVSYLNEADVAAVGGFLDSLRSPARTVQVRFYPEGDGLLFQTWDGNGLRISRDFFEAKEPGVYILHTSAAMPRWMRGEMQEQMRTAGVGQSAQPQLLRQRDGTEAWYFQLHAARAG